MAYFLGIPREVRMTKQHALYLRVSTKRQDTASQEPELKRWAQSHEGDSQGRTRPGDTGGAVYVERAGRGRRLPGPGPGPGEPRGAGRGDETRRRRGGVGAGPP